ncbi:MAG: nitroreductase [Bacteroidetes bacterium]|nr:nitroreductase [Bacteroidota bacterium]
MMTAFEQVAQVIKSRRTGKPGAMNGQKIPDEQINELLELAHWAPTHGRTEPWYFYVYTGDALTNFGKKHAELYWNNTPEETRKEETREKLEHNVDKCSHLIIAAMKRGENPKIPVFEELAATAAAIENILIGAEALGISVMWNTGGMALKQPMKDYMGLGEDDHVMGVFYMGYTDEEKREGKRNRTAEERVEWFR